LSAWLAIGSMMPLRWPRRMWASYLRTRRAPASSEAADIVLLGGEVEQGGAGA
jgi:hypothetical protein